MLTRIKRRKNLTKRYLLLTVILLLLGFGGWISFQALYKNDNHEAEATAKTFIRILENKSYQKLGAVLDRKSLQSTQYTLPEIKEKYDHIFNGINITQIHSSHIQINKNKYGERTLSYHLTMKTPLGRLKDLKYQATLVKSNGEFRLKWHPSLIFPGMEDTDKIAFHPWIAERGEIVDRYENKLAANEDFKWAGIIPKELHSGSKKKAMLRNISKHLHLSLKELDKKLQQNWVKDDLFVPLKIISSDHADVVPGISYQDTTIRYYPLKEAAANLIGYTGKVTKEDIQKHPYLDEGDTIGKTGLERTLDNTLRGINGGEIVIIDDTGEEKATIQKVDKTDGKDVQLTIDAHIQKDAYKSLNGEAGSTVIMHPKKGALYALASSPAYDPNKMVQGISQAEYDKYAKNERQPFIARFAVRYAPGSTFKAITASIGLDAGVTRPDKHRTIHGLSWQKDGSWGGYSVTRVSDVTDVDMRQALVYSDNIYFAQEALEMGEPTFRKGLQPFIFGEDLNLPIAMKPAQISNKKRFDSDILLADTGYGQGQLLLSPIHQVTMYSVFQNGGKLVYPHLLADKENSKTKQAISSAAAAEMKKTLQTVVSDPHGTAHALYDPNRQLAAKTGTAELKMEQGKKGKENSFLLAFDTKDDQFIMLSLVEDYSAGLSATQLNKPLIENLYNYLREP
ncbi:penicillin-binding transpeptidase domain-containing protein [Virgibacillus halophilus]|uniref:penicillin-binding protein PBP4(5) n=1 Tax=Tigheibacillus halophilus TaxID=361280 RepID=UPI0036F400A8